MIFDQYENAEHVVRQVVAALDAVLVELKAAKQRHEEHAESSDTIEGELKMYGAFRKLLARAGQEVAPLTRDELHERLAENRDHTEQQSGAYEKRIMEIEALKSLVLSKDVEYEASQKILDVLMAGLARAMCRIFNSHEWGHGNVPKRIDQMKVFALAIHLGFDAEVELKYPFMM